MDVLVRCSMVDDDGLPMPLVETFLWDPKTAASRTADGLTDDVPRVLVSAAVRAPESGQRLLVAPVPGFSWEDDGVEQLGLYVGQFQGAPVYRVDPLSMLVTA